MSDLRRIIWLASYPKSGNTWIRSLLAHYLMPEGKAPDINNLREFTTGDIRRDFFDAAAGEPFVNKSAEEWIAMRPKALRLIAASRPDHHFVKTHCQASKYLGQDLIPPEVTAAAIYIMRNPFDMTPSFARHISCDIDETIGHISNKEMIMGTPQTSVYDALGRWDDHVRSWTTAPGLPIHVIRYEDMIAHPAKEIAKLLEKFLRVPVDRAKLARSVKAASFESLKKQEEKHGFTEKPDEMESFFAKGKSGVWREDLTPAQAGRIREAFLPTIETWYPEMLKETKEFAEQG
ncbi:sulfotransferase domain-containing protein [Roseovarius sp. SYSU LYC5161]|uniref:sulfotransferase domain-containing protein n=1 Tax=Roseovarius halophilus (ex Wu et al. 2025) TaxID=3376060 RepID=UPI002871A01C|nr:sulfotransferase domain-containing protein [Roseovarius sp.]